MDIQESDIMQSFTSPPVPPEAVKMRLDKFLAGLYPQFSRNQLIRWIEQGVVLDDENTPVLDADYKVRSGQVFTVVPPDAEPAIPVPQDITLDVLYEDDDLLVVNKPAGMVVHPGAGNADGTMVNALLHHCGASLSGVGGVKRPGIVHRIDKETSGILVVAKNDFTHIGLSKQFEQHTIERIYQAFVWGRVVLEKGTITGDIGRSSQNRQKMAVVRQGKNATTHYERLAVFGRGVVSHVQCILQTGRTHQIRVHMTSIGHSLVGDHTYGSPPKGAPDFIRIFPRQALHAGYLGFIHPRNGQQMSFNASLPSDMAELLVQLQSLDK